MFVSGLGAFVTCWGAAGGCWSAHPASRRPNGLLR